MAVFVPLSPAELASVLARVLAGSARWDRPLDEFQVGQLKSAGSIGRHLAAELAGAAAGRSAFTRDLAAALDDAPGTEAAAVRHALGTGGADLSGADLGGADLGGALADLLAACRARPGTGALTTRIRGLLREHADAEVAALTSSPGEGRR